MNNKTNLTHIDFINSVKKEKRTVIIMRILILIIFLGLWEVLGDLKIIDPFLTSTPLRVIKSVKTFLGEGSLFMHIGVSCYETILGFTLGTLLGTLLAIILWWFPKLYKVLDPYLVVINALPKVALAPIIIFWVGNGLSSIIVIALLISIVVTILSVLNGFNEVDTDKIKLMKTFGANKFQILKYLVFPSSIPTLISSLKINIGLSWVGVIMGEFLVAKNGLGFIIVYGGQISQLDMVMMGVIILALLAYIMYAIISYLEKYILSKLNY